MKFGLNFFPTVDPREKSAAQYYDEFLAICARADELGFSSVKTVEHYFFAYGGYSPDPVTFLTAVAMRTKRIRLVTGAVLPIFNHPIKLAAKLAMLDNLSHGRLDVGFGRAFLPDEFAAFQVSMEKSRPRFEEGIEAVKTLWTQDPATFHGRFHQFGPVRLLPRPYQQPHPPIYIAAALNPQSLEWAGRLGYHIMVVPYILPTAAMQELLRVYRAAWRAAGHPPGQEQIQMSYHCYVAEDGDEARRRAKVLFDDYNAKFLAAVQAWANRTSTQYPGYENLVNARQGKSFESDYAEGKLFVGSPEEVVRLIEQARGWFGDFEASLQVNFSTATLPEALRTLELLAQHVIPQFQPAGTAGGLAGVAPA